MKRNILYVVRSLDVGGLERVVVNLANSLNRDVYQAYICCIAHAGELAQHFYDNNKIFVIGNEGRVNFRSMKFIYDIIRRHSIDVVHAHNLPGLFYSYAGAKLNRIPIIYTLHGFYVRRERYIFKLLEKIMIKSIEKIVCVSRELVPRVQKSFGLREDKISFIYNGIKVPELSNIEEEGDTHKIIFGSIGRVTYLKNYEFLISVFNDLLKAYPDCRLEIVGDGEKFDDITDLVKDLSLEKDVVLHGSQLNVDDYLRRFDIFVLPSIIEGHSIAILEALGMGKICVVSAVGGNTEIIEDAVNGFLFESRNKNDLMRRLTFVLENINSPEMDKVRSNAVTTVRSRFSVDEMVCNYEMLYRELLEC